MEACYHTLGRRRGRDNYQQTARLGCKRSLQKILSGSTPTKEGSFHERNREGSGEADKRTKQKNRASKKEKKRGSFGLKGRGRFQVVHKKGEKKSPAGPAKR